MSTLLLIFVVIAICLAVLEFALLFGRDNGSSEPPPGSTPSQPGHKPPPKWWFLTMSAILFILAVSLIWSIVYTFVTPRPIIIGSIGIVGTSYQISCQKLYDGTKFTTLAVVVCSALQFQLYILLLRQPSEELLRTDISILMLSFIAEYTAIFCVYLNVPQSPQPRVNIYANFGKVFCAITVIAALVSQPLYR
ncbi:hypothetical protein VE04_08864 [Pseudogymnoascus sp. 24MN13]|nr:hypothetical protein VE04_08864 [Pseudogymnoascus sp. 24MN13]